MLHLNLLVPDTGLPYSMYSNKKKEERQFLFRGEEQAAFLLESPLLAGLVNTCVVRH